VHYPSDTKGGELLAEALFTALTGPDSPQSFVDTLSKAQAEWATP